MKRFLWQLLHGAFAVRSPKILLGWVRATSSSAAPKAPGLSEMLLFKFIMCGT